MIESKFLKDNVQNIQKLMILPPLKKFETRHLQQLLKLSRIREYAPDENIIKEGAMDPWVYFLLAGSVRVEKDGVGIHTTKKLGELFGEMRILDGLARSASVFAETKTICLAVDTSASEHRLTSDERTDLLLFFYRMCAEFFTTRLRVVNDELVKTKKELEEMRISSK